jgi:hypothetical protein
MKTKFEKLLSDLNRKTPNKIAKFLEQNKIKGKNHPFYCPINKYLSRKLKINSLSVFVGPYHISCNKKTIIIPKNIRQFINNFDLGYYPKIKI